jgi:hypothetical protein
MNPWQLITILEADDPTFKNLTYPTCLRCPLGDRVARAIEEHWPAYFPARKECRGQNWCLSLPADQPLYKPREGSKEEMKRWKSKIKGTIAEGRAYLTDRSWKRFFEICHNYTALRPFLNDFKALVDFLTQEESMWPRYGGVAVGLEDSFREYMRALLAPTSPYRFADPQRLRFVQSKKTTIEKRQMIHKMRMFLDRPLMILAILQKCASETAHSHFWLNIQDHVTAIIDTPQSLAFRKTWLNHAMQAAGAIKITGESCPRKWARSLLYDKEADLRLINAKAVEVNDWLKGKKLPSVKSVRRSWHVIVSVSELKSDYAKVGMDHWLFSWMIVLWLEKHFRDIADLFNDDIRKIQHYYRRFFHYLKIAQTASDGKEAGGFFARQP